MKETKKGFVFRTMNENADKPMVEVLPLLMTPFGWDEATAKSYYLWAVRKGFAKGQAPAGKTRKPKASKVKPEKVAKVKPEKPAKKEKPVKVEVKPAKGNRFTGKVKAEKVTAEPKSDADIEKIKAANLKRMQEITARNKVIRSQYNGNIARGADDPFDPLDFTPEGARAEVDTIINEMDGFKAPRFLSKDQVKALV
jgi:hypothetical protein